MSGHCHVTFAAFPALLDSTFLLHPCALSRLSVHSALGQEDSQAAAFLPEDGHFPLTCKAETGVGLGTDKAWLAHILVCSLLCQPSTTLPAKVLC